MALIGDPVREIEYAPLEGPLVDEPPAEPAPVKEVEREREEVPA